MKKTREMIEKHLSFVDIVFEVCDARIPISSRNPVIDELTKSKPRIVILNKSDLADESATKKWQISLSAIAFNSLSGHGVKSLMKKLEVIESENKETGRTPGIPLRLMVVGIPNSGKSSFINRLKGKRVAQVGDKPGITRGKQWLTLENGMQLLDTPGILWPKIEDRTSGLNLAFCGSIKDEIMDIDELGLELIRKLIHEHPDALMARYGLEGHILEDDVDEALAAMEEIAKNRGFILPGARLDYERTARTVLDEFRGGKLGRITLEYPEKKAAG